MSYDQRAAQAAFRRADHAIQPDAPGMLAAMREVFEGLRQAAEQTDFRFEDLPANEPEPWPRWQVRHLRDSGLVTLAQRALHVVSFADRVRLSWFDLPGQKVVGEPRVVPLVYEAGSQRYQSGDNEDAVVVLARTIADLYQRAHHTRPRQP